MKDKITNSIKDIKTVSKNGTRLIEASALVIVGLYAVYNTLPSKHEVTLVSGIVLTAGIIIALRGAFETLRYLADKE